MKKEPLKKEQLEYAARIYNSNRYAAEALGISAPHFLRLCNRYAIDPPNKKRKKYQRAVPSKPSNPSKR